MNRWMASSDRFGCCRLKSTGMTSASVREDILTILWDIASILPQQVAYYLFVIVWHFSASASGGGGGGGTRGNFQYPDVLKNLAFGKNFKILSGSDPA